MKACVLLKDLVVIALAVAYAAGHVLAGVVLLTWYWVVGAVLLAAAVVSVLALLFGLSRPDAEAWRAYRVRPSIWRTSMRTSAVAFFAVMGHVWLAAVLLVLLLLIHAIRTEVTADRGGGEPPSAGAACAQGA